MKQGFEMRHARREAGGGATAVSLGGNGLRRPAGRHRRHCRPLCREVMSRDLVVVPSWLAASEVAQQLRWPRHARFPVVDAAGVPVGVLDTGPVAAAGGPPGVAAMRVLATPVVAADDPVPWPVPDGPAGDVPLVLVVEEGRLAGLITRGSLLRYARARSLNRGLVAPTLPSGASGRTAASGN